jgi:hypothetical protein
VILLSTGICNLVLTHVSAIIGSAATKAGAPGRAGGGGGASGGKVNRLPITSMPCTILMPRSIATNAAAAAAGGAGTPGMTGAASTAATAGNTIWSTSFFT